MLKKVKLFSSFAIVKGLVRHMTVTSVIGHMAQSRDIFSINKHPQECEVSASAYSQSPHCFCCTSGWDERHKWGSHFSFLEVCGIQKDH